MGQKRSSGGLRFLVVLLVLLVGAFVLVVRFAFETQDSGREVGLDQVYDLADSNQVVWVRLLDEDAQVVGRACSQPVTATEAGSRLESGSQDLMVRREQACSGEVVAFHATYPRSDVATQSLIEAVGSSAPVVVETQTAKGIAKLLATFVFPLLFLAVLFGLIFVSRSGDSSLKDVVGFGRMGRRQRRGRAGTGVTFADVGGAQEAVDELREVCDYLDDPRRFEAYGAAPPKGVLLFGPPGCGKTLLARAAAGESGVAFFSISGSEFIESLVGVGAARVRDLFRQVREVAPAIVFLDEIDAVGRRREGEGISGGEREQTVNQLLVEMDGFEKTAGIVVVGATNRPDILDPALLRPGRFDRHITVAPPDVSGREAILALHAQGKPLAAEVDLGAVARRTPGFTGADLQNVVNEAALLAIRQGDGGKITPAHLSEAVVRVLHGPQRRGQLMSPAERQRIAYHEAGHALVAAALGRGQEVARVSIVARGRGLGLAVGPSDSERVLLTRSEMEAKLAATLGGVAAEELCLGECSTAAEDDLVSASELARHTVGRYGMATEFGRLRLLSTANPYLDGEAVLDSVSSETMAAFDRTVIELMRVAEQTATGIVEDHRADLDRIVDALEAQETLEGPDLAAYLAPVQARQMVAGAGPRV